MNVRFGRWNGQLRLRKHGWSSQRPTLWLPRGRELLGFLSDVNTLTFGLVSRSIFLLPTIPTTMPIYIWKCNIFNTLLSEQKMADLWRWLSKCSWVNAKHDIWIQVPQPFLPKGPMHNRLVLVQLQSTDRSIKLSDLHTTQTPASLC